MPAPFPIQPDLTAIAIMYKNKRMIADQVAPRVPVNKEEFKYFKYDLAQGFTVPNTKVGRKSIPNEVNFNAIEVPAFTEDHGLDDIIPNSDIANAPENYDPVGNSVEQTSNLIELARETRVAGMVFNSSNYAAANQITLAGTDQFNDYVNSDPQGVLDDALDSMIMRGNIMTIGRLAFTKLSRHPDIVKAVHGNSGDKGRATRNQIAELFELEEVLVGESFVNTVKKGQTVSLARVWGNHISLQYRDLLANTRRGMSFAMTAQLGTRVAGQMDEPKIGLKGSVRVRAGEQVRELITANDLGYFIQNAIA